MKTCRSFVHLDLLVLVALSLGAVSCAHIRSEPRFGMTAHECWPERGRQVWCDWTLNARECELAHEAVQYVNIAVQYDVFHWRGRPPKGMEAVLDARNLVFFALVPSKVIDMWATKTTLAETGLVRGTVTGCIETIQIRLDVTGSQLSDASLLSVWRHELGHALGIPHHEEEAGLMFPARALDLEDPVPFSQSELDFLHFAYPVTGGF